MSVRMWWQTFSGLLGAMSLTQPGGRLSAPNHGPVYSSAGLAAVGAWSNDTKGAAMATASSTASVRLRKGDPSDVARTQHPQRS
jgi:hypothetical protein